MKRLIHFWPIPVALVSALVNVDALIIAHRLIMRQCGIGLGAAFVLIASIATVKLYYAYWFWRWLGRLLDDVGHIHLLKVRAKNALRIVRAEGAVDQFIDNLNNHRSGAQYRDHHLVKLGGMWAMFALGVWPSTGTRAIGIVVCSATSFRSGLHVLAAGNVIRVGYFLWLWKWFAWLLR